MNRSLTLKEKKQLVLNSDIKLAEQDGNGKGRYFVSRFIEPGIAHYEELGDILITKETLNKFIQTMIGVPVIIDHEDVTDKNVDKLRVGSVSKVWFDEFDGYFYCEGILTDPEAIDLVKNQGWNVSCAYSFVADETKKQHNGKDIDMEFTDGEFLHLAIVKNPRYEGANIVVNKNDEDIEWITVKGNHIPIKKGQSKDEAVKEFLEGKQSDTKDKSGDGEEKENSQKTTTQAKVKQIIDEFYEEPFITTAQFNRLEKTLGVKISDNELDGIIDKNRYVLKSGQKTDDFNTEAVAKDLQKLATSKKKEAKKREKDQELGNLIKEIAPSSRGWEWEKNGKEITVFFDDPKGDKAGKQWDKLIEKLDGKYGITDIMIARNSIGDITMRVLNELKEFIKNVVSNEKEEKMEVKNEDKRKLIDEVGGILKGKVDEELWRTVVGKLEKIAYEPSEDDKADNKAKNEEDEEEAKNKCKNEEDKKEEDKKDEKDEKAENEEEESKDVTENEEDEEKEEKTENKKVKNSIKDVVMGGSMEVQETKLYTSRKERLEEGNKY